MILLNGVPLEQVIEKEPSSEILNDYHLTIQKLNQCRKRVHAKPIHVVTKKHFKTYSYPKEEIEFENLILQLRDYRHSIPTMKHSILKSLSTNYYLTPSAIAKETIFKKSSIVSTISELYKYLGGFISSPLIRQVDESGYKYEYKRSNAFSKLSISAWIKLANQRKTIFV
jgi:hypothetical protein